MSFELVDFTTSSPFESLIQTLSYLIERRENKVDIHFQTHLLSLIWGGEDDVTEHLTGWKKDYYFILSAVLPKKPLSIGFNRAASLKKQLLSASLIALSNLNLLDSVSFLVVAQKNSNSILFEGFTGGQPCILESFDFMPPSLVNLEGIEKLYHSRKVSKISKEVYARINVSYHIHPIMPARFSSKRTGNWMQASMSSKIARLETIVTLTIQSEFESRLIDYFYDLERIDPFAGSLVAALLFEKSTFASLKPMLSQLTSLYYEFDNDAKSMPLDYIPGGFEGTLGNRVFLDHQEIIDALDYILTEEEDFVNSIPPAGLNVSVQQMLDSLRNQELTTCRNSLLWRFSKFLMECHCTSLHLNAKRPIIFQGLIKGVWKELLNHFQHYRDNDKFLPNTLKSSVPIEHCLLDQKICLLNYCISRNKMDGQRNKEYDQFGRKSLIRTRESDPPLYEPFTQDQSPMTSDMLQEQQMAFEELAKTHEGKRRLLNDQLAPLKSDIAAFKAANPTCTFVDFISWHSPKDLLDGGVLSDRFLNNGNVWKKCWEETIAAPIHKQKPLFDGERESAKALHYMENMSLQDLFLQLKPLLFILAYENLISQPCKEAFTPLVCSKINDLAANLSSGRYWADSDAVQEDILNLFEDCESALLLAEILIDNGLSISITDQLVAKSNIACAIPVEGEVFRLKRMLIGSRQEIPAPDKKSMIDIHDQLYSLRDENIQLKKKMTESEENTKKLLFKIQKLSEQATRNGTSHAKTKDDRESEEFISDLKSHVQNLNHNNTQLKTKMQYFKTLYENESKKRSQYTHIPPRIETGVPKRSSSKTRVVNKSNLYASQTSEELQKKTDTIVELQEINNRYRAKLEAQDLVVTQAKQDSEQLKQLMEQQMKNADIDRIALQHELNEMKRKFLDQRTKLDGVEEQHRLVSIAYKDICGTVESLGKDLADERKKSGDLDMQLQKTRLGQESEMELQVIITDLQAEKALLEKELAAMVDNRFATQRDDEFQAEILVLKQKIQSLEIELKQTLSEKARLEQELFDVSVSLATAQNNTQTHEARALELQHQIEMLQAKLQRLSRDKESEPSATDMEEAFALLRLKREAGLNFEFLSNWQQMEKDNQMVQELRRQYASCVQELEKTASMLNLEHKINEEHKIEIARLNEKIRSIQNEYELRLEEYSRLNDARRHKIEALEQQIRTIGHPEIIHEPKFKLGDLAGGDNVLQLTVHGAILSSTCSDYICRNNPELIHTENLVSFVSVDFYDFETEVSAIGIGMKPIFNHISKFCVTVDDFFLHYLQSGKVLFNFCYSNGVDFYSIGYCTINLSQLVSNDAKPFKYIGDIYAMSSNDIVLGCIEYSVEVAVPIPLAIKAYKERTLALNLNQIDAKKEAFQLKPKANNLNIILSRAIIERVLPAGKQPRIYSVIHFEPANHGIVTPTNSDSYMPQFNFETKIPVQANLDLDRHLRSGKVMIIIADEEEKNWVYGYCKIPLLSLAQGLQIEDTFPIESYNGTPCGELSLKIWWEVPYFGLEKPIVSLLDDAVIKRELDEASLSSAKTQVDVNSDHLSVEVIKMEFDPAAKEKLTDTKQLFVGVEICGFTDEGMESPSLFLKEDGIIDHIDFQTSIQIAKLIEKAKADNAALESTIQFSIVDEPPAESELSDCIDIGFATVNLISWADSGLENQIIQIPVMSKASTSFRLGCLYVKIRGVACFLKRSNLKNITNDCDDWKYKSHSNIICLFDIDGTLTPARKTISAEMKETLRRLREKVVVGFVGGSDLPKQVEQIGDDVLDLFDFSFAENGLTAYRLGQKLESASFIGYMGEQRYKRLVDFILRYIADLDIPIKRGTFVEFRNGMINVSPIGRNCSHPERNEFEIFDKENSVRSKFVDILKKEFADCNLTYSIGGQISFDVFPTGWDKTYCLRHIKGENFGEIHFFGDKTFKGGNDFEIFTHPDVKGHSVTCPEDTIKILNELFLK